MQLNRTGSKIGKENKNLVIPGFWQYYFEWHTNPDKLLPLACSPHRYTRMLHCQPTAH
jgi:hypothetical protein